MPSRYLRDGIIDSKRIGKLTEGAQLLYYKLLSLVDDYGRYDADPELLIIRAFPWAQSSYTPESINARLSELCSGEDPLMLAYRIGKRSYLELQDKSRKPIASKSKFPAPPVSAGILQEPIVPEGTQGDSPLSVTYTEPSLKDKERLAVAIWAQEVYDRHPKQVNMDLSLKALITDFSADIQVRLLFDKNHKAWCQSAEWIERPRYVPALAKVDGSGFIADGAWRKPPPNGSVPDVPIKRKTLEEEFPR